MFEGDSIIRKSDRALVVCFPMEKIEIATERMGKWWVRAREVLI